MQLRFALTVLAATCITAGAGAASAQSQTDTKGNAMGSQHVGNGPKGMTTPGMPSGTVGSNVRANGTNHPTPSSTQGDVGPGGNNNGTLTTPRR